MSPTVHNNQRIGSMACSLQRVAWQGVPNARALLALPGPDAHAREELFEGGSLTEVLRTLQQGGRDGGAAPEASAGGASHRVHVFHGICAWAEGQLEGVPARSLGSLLLWGGAVGPC